LLVGVCQGLAVDVKDSAPYPFGKGIGGSQVTVAHGDGYDQRGGIIALLKILNRHRDRLVSGL
jgi:hypothetical protein